MSEIAKKLTANEAGIIAAWLAAQPVSEALFKRERPAPKLSDHLVRRCGSIVLQSGLPQ